MTLGLGLFMLPCVVADVSAGQEDWRIFFLLSIASMTVGGVMALSAKHEDMSIRTHDAFVLTVVMWVFLVLVAAMPFYIGFEFTFTDAVFESMSGLTTTGATIMTGIEEYPHSLILWRALLQWIGGIGIIVTAIAILPSLQIGGMQLFHLESSDTYSLTGLNEFDAITMSMTTVATGGFAVSDGSFAPYVANGADIVCIFFMCLCSLPFAAMVLTLHGETKAFFRDPQVGVWLSMVVIATAIMTLYISNQPDIEIGEEGALRLAAFNVISILSGTGYGTADFALWGAFPGTIFILLMFLGGTAGSASCGLKTFRVHIAAKAIMAYTKNMIRPNQVSPVRYNKKRVKEETLQSIMIFMFLYLASFAVLACGLAFTGLEPVTAISAAAASISNVGPGLGEIVGPAGTFAPLTDPAKWMCMFAMLLGRLELISVFVILSPSFWRD